MARLFKKAKEQEVEDEFEEYENSPEQREENVRQNRNELPKLPPLPRKEEKTMVVEREVTLSLLNEKMNYLISILEKELKE